MPEVFSSTLAWRRRLGFGDFVRWTRRQLLLSITISFKIFTPLSSRAPLSGGLPNVMVGHPPRYPIDIQLQQWQMMSDHTLFYLYERIPALLRGRTCE